MAYSANGPVVWPLLPNWKRGVEETLGFRTSATRPTLTGLVQKKKTRIAPRRGFRFEVHPYGDGRRLLETLRLRHGLREWHMPVWPDRQSLAADLASGANAIPCATEGYDFAPGRFALLRAPLLHTTQFEVVEIDTVEEDEVTLAGVTSQAWPAGSFLYPLRLARLVNDAGSATLLTDNVSTLSVACEMSEPCDWPAHTFADEYRGLPVWEFRHNWRGGRELGFSRIPTIVDNSTGVPVYYDFPDKPFVSVNASWLSRNRAEGALLRGVLYALAGRFGSLWVPTGAADLVPVADAETTLTAAYSGYEDFALGQEGRKDVRIELVDGTVYYRRITDAGQSGGNEVLTLNSALPSAVSPQNIRRVSYLARVQQVSDDIAIAHLTNQVCSASFVFEGSIEPPEEGA